MCPTIETGKRLDRFQSDLKNGSAPLPQGAGVRAQAILFARTFYSE